MSIHRVIAMSVTEHRQEGETPESPVSESVYDLLTDVEASGARAYVEAFRAEYERVYDQRHAGDMTMLRFWQSLAHTSARVARERTLALGLDATEL